MAITTILILYLILLVFKACSSSLAIRHQDREPNACPVDFSSASILQPILSGDPLLKDQLAWNVANLPDVEFIWLIDEDDRTALTITTEIQREHPRARIKIIEFGAAPESVNPKSYKLEQAWRTARGSICVVLDDDSRLFPETLRCLLSKIEARTIVTALPYYEDQGDLPSQLLATFVNNNAALTYLSLLPYRSPVSINGMCYALSKQFLSTMGGYQSILGHLADDLAIATLVRDNQGKIRQIHQPVAVQTSLGNLSHYWRQAHRWFLFASLLLARQSNTQKGSIFLLHGLPPLLLWCLLVLTAIQHEAPVVTLSFGALLLLRAVIIGGLQRKYSGKIRHRPLLSILSELLQPLRLCHALISRKIVWRSRRLRVFSNERFESA